MMEFLIQNKYLVLGWFVSGALPMFVFGLFPDLDFKKWNPVSNRHLFFSTVAGGLLGVYTLVMLLFMAFIHLFISKVLPKIDQHITTTDRHNE